MNAALEFLTARLELADELRLGKDHMFEPQDLPGRYGEVVRALDQLLHALGCQAVVAGGWAVWRFGFHGCMTQDIDIILAADRLDEFPRTAAVSGFDVPLQAPGRWPKLLHKETGIKVDILPEGQRPGTASKPAPTALPHPSAVGAGGTALRYITLPALIELKLAAGRGRDESDVIELVRANPDQVDAVRKHLAAAHADYLHAFDRFVQRAQEQRDE